MLFKSSQDKPLFHGYPWTIGFLNFYIFNQSIRILSRVHLPDSVLFSMTLFNFVQRCLFLRTIMVSTDSSSAICTLALSDSAANSEVSRRVVTGTYVDGTVLTGTSPDSGNFYAYSPASSTFVGTHSFWHKSRPARPTTFVSDQPDVRTLRL